MRWEREGMSEGKHAIEQGTGGELCQVARALAHRCHKQMKLVANIIYIVNGNGAAQKGGRRTVYPYFYKLPGEHLGEGCRVGEHNEYEMSIYALYLHNL